MKDIRNTIHRRFYLEKSEDKLKLVELLLVIGSLLTAFKLESYYIVFFLVFVMSSIPYFIMVQKGLDKNDEDKRLLNYFSLVIAATFSGIVSSVLAINGVGILSEPVMKVVFFIILYVIYLIFLFPVIWTALKPK